MMKKKTPKTCQYVFFRGGSLISYCRTRVSTGGNGDVYHLVSKMALSFRAAKLISLTQLFFLHGICKKRVVNTGRLRRLQKSLRGKGVVRNYSSKFLWIVENTSMGKPIAHKLAPQRRSPPHIDSDGFKRVDGQPIRSHRSWWKIYGYTTADIYDQENDLSVHIVTMKKVKEDEFGSVEYDLSPGWGIPFRNVIGVRKNKKGNIQKYLIEHMGWISKFRAVEMACEGLIDNAVVVFPGRGMPYLRSRPDGIFSNNFLQMG